MAKQIKKVKDFTANELKISLLEQQAKNDAIKIQFLTQMHNDYASNASKAIAQLKHINHLNNESINNYRLTVSMLSNHISEQAFGEIPQVPSFSGQNPNGCDASVRQ